MFVRFSPKNRIVSLGKNRFFYKGIDFLAQKTHFLKGKSFISLWKSIYLPKNPFSQWKIIYFALKIVFFGQKFNFLPWESIFSFRKSIFSPGKSFFFHQKCNFLANVYKKIVFGYATFTLQILHFFWTIFATFCYHTIGNFSHVGL